MKKILSPFFVIFLFLLSSCTVIGGIFKAGVGVGIFIVVAILALVIYLVTRGSNKN